MLTRTNIQRLARAEQGVPLWGCTPGSPAALAGLRYGDIVLSVDGRRTRSAEEYVAAKAEERAHVIVFRRGAEVRTTTIVPGPSVWPDMTASVAELAGSNSFWALDARSAPTYRN